MITQQDLYKEHKVSFPKKIYRRSLLSFMNTGAYSWPMLHVIPYIRFSFYYTSLPGWKYKRGYQLLRPGDIVLTNDKWKLTSMLIPGEFSHGALCLSKDDTDEFEIAEMTHDNLVESTFYDLCAQATRVVILRCDDWDEDYINSVIIPNCIYFKNEDIQYDTLFLLGVIALYCSELPIACDKEKRAIVSYEDLAGLGRPYISPTGLFRMMNGTVVWDSMNEVR